MQFMSQAEFARHRGVSKMAVSKWKSRGLLVVNEADQVDVVATDAQIDNRPAVNRGGSATKKPSKSKRSSKPRADDDAESRKYPPRSSVLDSTPEGQAMTQGLTHADAARVKEIALARRQMQAFEREQGKLVDIETVARLVEQEYAVVRERLLAIPGKLAAKLVDRTRSEIEAALLEEVTEALDELHDPDFDGGDEPSVEAAEGSARAQTASAAEPGRMG